MVALSFDSAASPTFSLGALAAGGHRAYGWGFAWYPEQAGSALLVKDATSLGDNPMTKLLREWERFESTIFIAHLRGAARALQERDTHPFSRAHGGREFVFAHNGDLNTLQGAAQLAEALPLGNLPVHEPIGRTDSERAFCWLLTKMHELGARALFDAGWLELHSWFRHLNTFGTANFIISDGRDLIAYADVEGYNRLHTARFVPPNVPKGLHTPDLSVGLEDAWDRIRTVMVISTVPLAEDGFTAMEPGQLIVVRRGALVFDSTAPEQWQLSARLPSTRPGTIDLGLAQRPTGEQRQAHAAQSEPPISGHSGASDFMNPSPAEPGAAPGNDPSSDAAANSQPVFLPEPTAGEEGFQPTGELGPASGPMPPVMVKLPEVHHHEQVSGPGRLLSVEHRTVYRYDATVEKSFHLFRLEPLHDRWQDLVEYRLEVSVDGQVRRYEDVFGNIAVRADIETPFQELVVQTNSLVRVRGEAPADLDSPRRRFQIPLVWMPWQRQMMTPYLLPPELPETQLRELSDFAMSFVERQDFDLVQTLFDMNATIYKDFQYVSGSTTTMTTPFEVFSQRRGVCQDFANLLICMARLLSIPARYRVGYIYTGGDYENKMQSDASHAWAELYLPWTGWQGFDPTNGCLVGLDHVRVACGRNYGDATPTSGTIYKGGGSESLSVTVKVKEAQVDGQG